MNQYPNWPNIIGGAGSLQTLSINGQNLSLNPGGGTVAIPITTATPGENIIASTIQLGNYFSVDSNGDLTTTGTISADQNITTALSVNSATMNATTATYSNTITSNFTACNATIRNLTSQTSFITNGTVQMNAGATVVGTLSATGGGANGWSVGNGTISTLLITGEQRFGGTGGTIMKYATPIVSSLTFFGRPVNFSTTVNFLGGVNGIPGLQPGGQTIQISTTTTSLLSVSTINFPLSFDPNFNPSVEVNLGDQASQYLGKATLATGALAVVVSGVALGTGITALANSRTTNYINSNVYETVNGTTQIQVSTLADYFSTVYRFTTTSNTERFVSTIYPPGQAIRSFSDPLYGVSSPTQCFQSFGQWVSLPQPVAPSFTLPANLSSLTFVASNYVSTSQVRTSSILVGGLNGVGSGELSLTTPYFQTPIMRFGASETTDGFLNAQGFNWTYPGQAQTPTLKTTVIPYNNKWQIATLDSLGNNNIIAYLTDLVEPNPKYSTMTVAQSSIISGVSLSNGIINTPAEVQCLALETLNVLAFTGMETNLLTTSTINNRFGITTNSLVASTITAQQMNYSNISLSNIYTNNLNANQVQFVSTIGFFQQNTLLNTQGNATLASVSSGNIKCSGTIQTQLLSVIQGGSYIPYLSTNEIVQGQGYVIDSDTNPPYLSTLGISTVSLWAKSPTTGGNQKLITSCDVGTVFIGAQYYKSAQQNAPSGAVDVLFDLTQPWNQVNGCMTHTNGTAEFDVVVPGLYQLEFAITYVANGTTWTTTSNKGASIDITRGTRQVVLTTSGLMASGQNYTMSVIGTVELQAGDRIHCRSANTFATGANGLIQCVQNTFDYNTTFTWRLIRSL